MKKSEIGKRKATDPKRLAAFFDEAKVRVSESIAGERNQKYLHDGSEFGRETFLSNPKESLVYKIEPTGGGIFGTASLEHNILPQSESERIFYNAPEVNENKCLAVKNESVRIGGVSEPKPFLMSRPKVVKDCFLLLPEERRHLMRCEVERQNVRRLRRKAQSQSKRMIDLMSTRYRGGILGLRKVNGSPENRGPFDTDLYSKTRSAIDERDRRKVISMRKRQESTRRFLDTKTLLRDDAKSSTTPVTSVSGSRKGSGGHVHLTMEESRRRLFDTAQNTGRNVETSARRNERSAYLKRQDRGGRAYNIISGSAW